MTNVLSEFLIVQKSKVDNIEHVRSLNVWGMELEDIAILRRLPALQVCSLSVNRIDSLAVFEACPDLRELYLRKNRIADLRELYSLRHCPRLRSLWLGENPIAAHPGYRLLAVKLLHGLTKLDDADITDEDRAQADRYTEEQLLNFRSSTDAPRQEPRKDVAAAHAQERRVTAERRTPSREDPHAHHHHPQAAKPQARKVPVRHVASADPNARNTYNGDDVPIGGGPAIRKPKSAPPKKQHPAHHDDHPHTPSDHHQPHHRQEQRRASDPHVAARRPSRDHLHAHPHHDARNAHAGHSQPGKATAQRQRYSPSPEYRPKPSEARRVHADPLAPPRSESPRRRNHSPAPGTSATPAKAPHGAGGARGGDGPHHRAMFQSVMSLMPHLSMKGLEAVAREVQGLLRERADERDQRLQ